MTLTQGRLYRAYLSLPFLATEGMARARLESVGFADVTTYHDQAGRLCVQGRWSLATQVVDIPSALSSVTEVT